MDINKNNKNQLTTDKQVLKFYVYIIIHEILEMKIFNINIKIFSLL